MTSAAPATEASACQRSLDILESEAAALCGNRQRIEEACSVVRESRDHFTDRTLADRLPRLAQIVSSRVAGVNAPIVAMLCEVAPALSDPLPLLERLLDSSDGSVIAEALECLGRVVRTRRSLVDGRLLQAIAVRMDREGSPLSEDVALRAIASLVAGPPGGRSALESLCAEGSDFAVRRLAARLLDLSPSPPADALAVRMLGADAAASLAPYLAWTRATHRDLVALASGPVAATLRSLHDAEEICGEKLLREIIGEAGWARLNFGLSVRRFIGVSVDGSFPLLVTPAEEALLEDVPGKRRMFDRLLVVANGGEVRTAAAQQDEVISRFRAYNLAHAELLAGFLEITPLTVEKVRLTVARMDHIVEEFQFLFAASTDECPLLASLYSDLRQRIEQALASETGKAGEPLSPELTRLVEMFEDPRSLIDVHTLHGLKRYLHQRGLKLGMRLAEAGHSANRTITLLLATPDRVLHTANVVEYVDFEAESADDGTPPYPVQVVIDEFARQLVHAEQALPKVKIFCYGNEVHYFIAYRNHPAFVRIDYSPPGRGGMIDLAYFGVSKYELDAHPDVSLPALQRFFRRLDFNIEIESTHVHARYDKERAFDLGDLCEKAAGLFRLAPYLMDLDWVIGDLALSHEARREVAGTWADFFAEWGVLPYQQFLTADRRGILAGVESQAGVDREVRWDGSGPYRDRFTVGTPAGLRDHIASAIARCELQHVVPLEGEVRLSQVRFEQSVARPLRDACARGEVSIADLRPEVPQRFERRHPAECLVEVLQSDARTIASSAHLADVVALLSRGLRFNTSGAINGYEVHAAALPLPGKTVGLYALRDGSGIFRLAVYATGVALHVSRRAETDPWRKSWSVASEVLAGMLRRANYPVPWIEPPATDTESVSARLRELFGAANVHAPAPPLPGELVVAGVPASPGRAVGPARLGLLNRHPSHVDGGIVICESMSPADGAFLGTASAVVTTGGGALSHAGLLALQYGKPALIIPGTWQRFGASLSALTYRTLQYEERHRLIGDYRVSERHEVREREEVLREGDLVVVDADRGLLRALGQEPDTLAFHDSFRQLNAASGQLAAAASDPEILVERGRRLRALHQLERVLGRIADPILARHAASELLLQDGGSESSVAPAEKGRLLALLLANRVVGNVAIEAVHGIVDTLTRRLAAETAQALRLIPQCRFAWEVLSLRLDVRRLAAVVFATRELIAASGVRVAWEDVASYREMELLATERLRILRGELIDRAAALSAEEDLARLHHVIAEIDRIDLVLGTPRAERRRAARIRERLEIHDETSWVSVASRRIIDANSGGIELRPVAGSKAANLAQVARFGEGNLVPPWFVVTDLAFREALESPLAHPSTLLHGNSVRAAVEDVLGRPDLANPQRASLIRAAWDAARLPDDLVDAVTWAYATLAGEEEPFVAVRSSATEEDVETATRAGEFDTFLFVRGEDALIANLKRAWSGLWSERALHNRTVFGFGGSVGGGVIVQKMIASQVSGVLHTVNVAERRLREMVINAGLGLGEGVVSGAVAADRIVVSKEGDLQHGELHFRYLTAEKRERVVFNSRLGSGTARVETLYHQRLRPALEYVEICQLVRAADRLERAYGYPLDIEFAIEGTNLYLLQVRPIPTPIAVWRETAERWPLAANRESRSHRLEEVQ